MRLLLEGTNCCDEFEWDDINYSIDLKGSFFRAVVKNFGWRKLNGKKYLQAKNFTDVLSSILPNTECNFKVFKDGRNFVVKNCHHDNCCGDETYTITPCAESTYLRNK
jgi:hypothetical protein